MTMANGTQTHSADKRIQFKPRKTSSVDIPDAPEGEWEALIPKGKCRVAATQKGDPRVFIPFKLEEAMEEKNVTFQGSEVVLSAIIFDDEDNEKRRGANMMKGRLRALCEAVDVEFAEVYPSMVETAADFDKLFRAVEGKKLKIWTVHTKRTAESGEEITETEVRFRKPGAGLVVKDNDGGDDDDRPGKSKKAGAARRK